MSGQGLKILQAQMADYQPQSFAFTPENLETAKVIIAKYPAGKQQSALMPLLTLAQQQNANWLPVAAMDYVAQMLEIPPMRAYEVATFYTMYNLKPVGKHFIEICTTTPCWLRGSDDIVNTCRQELGIEVGETTADGLFTLVEAECLCACVNAPMIQIGQHYYEDLTPESMRKIIQDLRVGREPKPGPQNGRNRSEPAGGRRTLLEDVNRKLESTTAKRSTKIAATSVDAVPNKPSEDEPKARHKNIRQPAVENVPTTEEVKNGKTAKLAEKSTAKLEKATAAKETTITEEPDSKNTVKGTTRKKTCSAKQEVR